MSDHELLNRWNELRGETRTKARGLVLENFSGPLGSEWLDGLDVWSPLKETVTPDRFDVVILENLTSELRTNEGIPVFSTDGQKISSRVQRAVFAIGVAIQQSKLILCTTPNVFSSLNILNQSTIDIESIDVPSLVAGDELIYLLQCYCEMPNDVSLARGAALYLTPIERSLASLLESEGRDFVAQKKIGRFTADFLLENFLVVECDGAPFHNSKKDENRDKELASIGYVTVRLPGLLIRTDPKRCLQLIDDGLSRLDLGSENLREHIPKLGSLSLNQQVATEHGLGPAMVLAPAGSGKTKVVTERVFNLVRSGAAAERIMCVSFTNTAVNEIRERFRKMAVERDLPQLLEVRVSTLNSLGSKICRDSIEYANLKILNKSRNPREKTQLQVLRTVLTKFSKDSKQREVFFAQSTEISEAISAYRQSLRVPSLDDHSLDLGLESEIERELLFRDIHSAYEKHLISIQMTDFDGQILNALRVLVSDRNKRIKFAREIDYWVVDEFQDLALPKMMMLRLLVAPARNVMVVGDDDQIIFGFAGARFELFEAFNQHWGDLETYLLNTNYRSNHEIVTRASWLISRNQLRVKKNIIPHSALDSEASVQVSYGLHYWEEVLDIILEERGKGTPLDQIGLLFRTTVSAAPVEKILREAKIPHNKLVKSSFFGSRTIQRLRSWMKIINKVADEADWVLALSWPERYLSTNFINWLCDVEGDIEERLIAISEGALEIPFAVLKRTNQEEGMARDAISQFIYAVNNARKEGKDPVRQLMSLGFADIFSKDQVIEPINQKNPKLNKRLDGNSFSGLLAYQAFEDTLRTCKTYLEMERWISAAKSDPDIEWVSSDDDSNPKDQIKLSSIHAFKGKQLPVICVLGRGGSMPDYRAKEQEELEEERRVAYVAVTRAERRLFFCASEQYGAEMSVSEYGQSWEQYKSQAGGEKDENSPT